MLLIAYEFPPSPSPQSLRWAHLVRELLRLGVEVHVLTAENWWPATSTQPPEGTTVHRAWPGGVAGIIALSRRWRRLRGRADHEAGPSGGGGNGAVGASVKETAAGGGVPDAAGSTLNWKGRAVDRLNSLVRYFTFPDERGRWEPAARRELGKLLASLQPDVVISSHEPATSLRLGRLAKEHGLPWIADMGDPVLSFYTPVRWRKKSFEVESWTCAHADRVTVTTEAAKSLLARRHGVPESRFAVLTQGYDGAQAAGPVTGEFDLDQLELLYTGSFYQFREPRALVDAVLSTPQVRLSIATSRAPGWLLPLLDAHPEQLRLLGFVPHARAVALQRGADVLVNIANDDPVHVPGKVYEYLGAGRPILHLGDNPDDVAAGLVTAHRRGLVSGNGSEAIARALAQLVEIKQAGEWSTRFDLQQAGVEQYQWQSIARRLHAILEEVAGAS